MELREFLWLFSHALIPAEEYRKRQRNAANEVSTFFLFYVIHEFDKLFCNMKFNLFFHRSNYFWKKN